ncbi:hypothetical protein BD289DRAFT_379601 [Coniella lustricola]|uniref:Zn(2)-C6 fungal-type domain-containing protein n=1 Tax=Coniella lustricola TaxID=2025994 RepID=A0A2T2ZSG8_9PEZI|nr:hypothetical protein BD289DRAFT_379601 [Coniella lustricola]
MPRLGYTKSRNGCMRCRQRRVKCDEKRPCTACIRHDVRCSLLDAPVPAERWRADVADKEQRPSGTTHASSSSTSPRSSAATSDPVRLFCVPSRESHGVGTPALTPTASASATATDRFNYFDKFLLPLSSQTEAAWIQDLELMHHYTMTTAPTLPRAKTALHVWQQLVPQLATRHPFLVHQVLAMAAFHKAYLQPDRRSEYSLLASQHQNHAIEGIRSHLSGITEQNCHALFMTSSLLLICAFAAISHGPPSIEDMLDVFMLDRGVSIVLQSSEQTIQAGEFHAMFTCTPPARSNTFLAAVVGELRAFERRVRHEHDQGLLAPATAELISLEVARLVDAVDKATMTTEESEMRVVSYWPITMADEYLALLRQRSEPALALLAYYCCIMRRAEASMWFLGGWAQGVAADAERFLSPRWRAAVQWPLDQLRQAYAWPMDVS